MQSGGTPSSLEALGARDSVQGSYIGVRIFKLRPLAYSALYTRL